MYIGMYRLCRNFMILFIDMYCLLIVYLIPVVPHKAGAELSRIGNL